jgi:predicted DsbA family dithiol-disulfide isomerase
MFGAERVAKMRPYLLDFAKAQGIAGMVIPPHKPNTRKALALAEWARDRGKLHEVRTAIMDAYWRSGLDVEDDAVLARVVAEAGFSVLEGAAAIRESRMPEVLARVATMGREAAAAGVSGIPTFDIGTERVVGAQPYPALAEAVVRQGGRPRTPVSGPRRS